MVVVLLLLLLVPPFTFFNIISSINYCSSFSILSSHILLFMITFLLVGCSRFLSMRVISVAAPFHAFDRSLLEVEFVVDLLYIYKKIKGVRELAHFL